VDGGRNPPCPAGGRGGGGSGLGLVLGAIGGIAPPDGRGDLAPPNLWGICGRSAGILRDSGRPGLSRGLRQSPESLRQSPENLRQLPESLRQLPESLRQLPESLRQLPESLRQLPESLRQSPESLRQSPESLRQSPESRRQSPESPRPLPQNRKTARAELGSTPDGIEFFRADKSRNSTGLGFPARI